MFEPTSLGISNGAGTGFSYGWSIPAPSLAAALRCAAAAAAAAAFSASDSELPEIHGGSVVKQWLRLIMAVNDGQSMVYWLIRIVNIDG